VVAQPDERLQTEQLLFWSDMTGTEHTTSVSNKQEQIKKSETVKNK